MIYGSASGLSGWTRRVFHSHPTTDAASPPDNSDQYGYALAAGDIDADGDDDLAIGVVKRVCPNGGQRSGGVVILKGSTSLGLSTLEAQSFQPGQNGMLGDCLSGAYFGAALSIGKVDGQAYQGLAIGAPLTDVGGVEKSRCRALHVRHSQRWLNTALNRFISVTDLPGGVAIPFLQFGGQVKLGQAAHQRAEPGHQFRSNETVNGLSAGRRTVGAAQRQRIRRSFRPRSSNAGRLSPKLRRRRTGCRRPFWFLDGHRRFQRRWP